LKTTNIERCKYLFFKSAEEWGTVKGFVEARKEVHKKKK
jgi:hypothetical protein